MSHVLLWARAFLITVSVESVVATPLLADNKVPKEKRVGLPRRLGIVLFAQCMSHPAVWFIFPALGMSYTASLTLSELWAVGSEIAFYRLVFPDLRWSRVVAASALANAASFGLGLLFRPFL